MRTIPQKFKVQICGSLSCCILFSLSAYSVDLQPRPGAPIPSLSDELMMRFELGKIAYETDLSVEDGLGPIFNQTSCASCHNNPVGGAGNQTVTRFGMIDKKGGFDPLTNFGGSLLQAQANSDDCLEFVPAEANVTSLRVTNGALAFGFVEAIADWTLLENQQQQDESIRGKAHMVSNFEDETDPLHVGRFGWKAQVASVLTFSSDASLNEMGLTNRFLPIENAPNGNEELLQECDTVNDPEDGPDSEGFDFIDRVTDFQRLLAPPPQTPRNGMSGEVIFNQIGCVDCHTKTFVTSADNSIMEPLRDQTIHPYSDFLLHDMGISGDGIVQGAATGRELKTPPLWGLAYRTPLWHDGRIDIGNFEVRMNATINEHGSFGSQGQTSTSAFNKLSPIEQSQLFAFLKSLGQVEFDGDSDGDVELDDFHGYSDTIGFHSCFEVETTPDDPCAIHDINQDGIVNLDDFDLFVVAFDDELADCNENGTTDMLDILLGADDNNNNGILDDCETCLGDVNGDNALNVGDILAIIDAWGLCDGCAADVNSDGTVNVTDLLFIVGNWGPCS